MKTYYYSHYQAPREPDGLIRFMAICPDGKNIYVCVDETKEGAFERLRKLLAIRSGPDAFQLINLDMKLPTCADTRTRTNASPGPS